MDDAVGAMAQQGIVGHDDQCRSPLLIQFEEEIHDLFTRGAI